MFIYVKNLKNSSPERESFYFAPFNGMQCTAVALISLILLMNQGVPEFEDTYQRDPSFLDLILHEGTSLYGKIVHERRYTGVLGHEQFLQKILFIFGHSLYVSSWGWGLLPQIWPCSAGL